MLLNMLVEQLHYLHTDNSELSVLLHSLYISISIYSVFMLLVHVMAEVECGDEV